MARTEVSRERIEVVRESYFWPDTTLNLWVFVMLITGAVLVGIFSQFIQIQNQLGGLGIPWIMPFGITVGALLLVYILVIVGLTTQRRLLPGVVILGCFVFAVLFLTGLIATAIQLFGPVANINGNCQQYVFSQQQTYRSGDIYTLAWLEQNGICQAWQAAFAFWIIGFVMLIYFLFVAINVARHNYDQ